MSQIRDEVLAANDRYASGFDKGDLPMPPARRFAISLVISYKLLGTREWFVVHHTDCGMETFTDEVMRGLLASSLKTATVDASGWHDSGEGPGSTEGNYIDWLTIKDNAQSVVEDVRRIRNHPLVPAEIPIYGYIYDVRSGRLVEVPGATEAGRGR
ncbi:MAG: carbonic anhydrase [Chromatiaceae bacterium]|nr:carbonic anhydrase [Chromatiaceae bacterium]